MRVFVRNFNGNLVLGLVCILSLSFVGCVKNQSSQTPNSTTTTTTLPGNTDDQAQTGADDDSQTDSSNLDAVAFVDEMPATDVPHPDISPEDFEVFRDEAFGAISSCDVSEVRDLHIPDSGIKNKYGYSPLMEAIRNRDCEEGSKLEIVKHFITFVDVNEQDNNGNTALHWAVISRNKDAVSELLSHENIDINIKDQNGRTPLVKSVLGHEFRTDRLEVLKLLVANQNVAINAVDDLGKSAVMYAATLMWRPDPTKPYVGYPEAVKLLLSHPEIDLTLKDNVSGHTAFDIAELLGRSEIASLLANHPSL